MRGSRVLVALPLLYQQLFYCPPPPAAAAPDAVTFNFAATTTVAPFRKTLFYQANIAPPLTNQHQPAAAQSFSVTTGQAFSKTRFYQANITPPRVPPAVAVTAPTIDWQQPFSRLPAIPAPTTRYIPFVAPPAPQVTADEWLVPFTRAVARPPVEQTQPVSGYQPEAAVVSNLTTTLEWMPAWTGPPRLWPLKGDVTNVTNQPQPPNTTTLEWQIAWQKAVPAPPARPTQPFYGYPYNGPNLTTTLDWLQPFQRQVPGPYPVHTQPVIGYGPAPQVTPDEWLQPFYKAVARPPVEQTQPVSGYQPEAVVSNLTTTLEWLQPFQRVAPPARPEDTQLVSGYQPAAAVVSNLTTTLEWMSAWTSPPRYWPQKTDVTNVNNQPQPPNTTTLEWQIAWQASKPTRPTHTQPVLGTPPEPPVTPDKWQIAWQGAKPSKPVHTQPVLGSPYFLPNLTSTLEWLQQWRGPPRYWPPKADVTNVANQPQPPNTTTLEWLTAWQKAVPAPKPIVTQPFYGYPYVSAPPPPNLTTTLEWLPQWQGPPRYWPLKVQQTPFIPKEFVQDQVTPDKWLIGFQRAVATHRPPNTQPFLGRSDVPAPTLEWLQQWRGPPRYKPVYSQPVFVYSPPVIANLTTSIEWLRPFNVAVKPPTGRPTQPFYGYPYTQVAAVTSASFSVTSAYPVSKTRFYQAWVFGRPPPVVPANTVTIEKWQQPLSSLVPRLTARHTQPFYGYPYEQALPPAPIPPKHAHGQVHTAGAETLVTVSGHGVCYPAFQQDAFSAAFQTCEDLFLLPVRSGERVRTARSSTSSRWRKSRGRIRSSRSKTTTRDDP